MSETYDKENHWYGWNGGECPVHPETTIEAIVEHRDRTSRLDLQRWKQALLAGKDFSGKDIARLVEVAALTHALKQMGHDPAKDFNDRLIAFMAAQAAEATPTRIKPIVRD